MPEFTPIGQRVEELRKGIRPRLSQEALAAAAGVTRQHLGRVLTGKADLKLTQWQRVADALGVELAEITAVSGGQWEPDPDPAADEASAQGVELEAWVQDMDRIVRTLRTAPRGPLAIPLKLAILDAAEEAAEMVGATMPKEFMEIRRKVLTGEM